MTTDPEDSEHTIEFLDSFADLEDPRQQAKVFYPLEEILLLCLCAVLGGADCWVKVAPYGQQRLQFLRRFLPFQHGTPSHDQLGILFAKLDSTQFQQCFIAWVQRFTAAVRGMVAVDGKLAPFLRSRRRAGADPYDLGVEFSAARGAGAAQGIAESPTRSPRSRSCWSCRARW